MTSQTLEELRKVSPMIARKTLNRLIAGYSDKSGASYPAATTNSTNCVLATKAANRSTNGYVQIAPVTVQSFRSHKGIKKPKPSPQNAHRLAILAYKPKEEIDKLLSSSDYHASHLCSNTKCINGDHLVVESKYKNEARKICRARGPVVAFELEGELYESYPNTKCICDPKCIPHREVRQVIKQ